MAISATWASQTLVELPVSPELVRPRASALPPPSSPLLYLPSSWSSSSSPYQPVGFFKKMVA